MKIFALVVLFFSTQAFATKYAILCRKAETFDQAVAKINAISTDPQWPVELAVEKNGALPQSMTINAKSAKYDMANFKVLESEEDIKTGKTSKKTKFYQACIPIEFD